MTTYTHNGQWAHRLGHEMGHAWRGFMRAERRIGRWLETCGVPESGAQALLWLANIVLVAVLLYVAFWLGVLILLAAGATWAISSSNDEKATDWTTPRSTDHKNSPFYDPINYNDDPDPRFEEDQ